LLASSGFLWDLWQPGHWSLFLEQIKSGAESKLGEGFMSKGILTIVLLKISNLFLEHQRFFWSDRVQAFSLIFWVAFAFNFRTLWSKNKDLIIYLISLIVSLSIFSSHIAERYLIYYLPFMAITISIGITNLKNSGRSYLYFIYSLVFVLNLISVGKQFHEVFSLNQKHVKKHKEILNKIPDKEFRIFAPWRFIYNEIGNYNLMSYQALQYYQDNQKQKFTRNECINILKNKFRVKYVILDNSITDQPVNDYDWFKGLRKQKVSNLSLLYEDKNYQIFMIN
jgi:hypothetical protein